MKIPVNRNISDPFYRYKMPALEIKKEGKSGQKTILLNLNEISRDLKRNPNLILKFLSIELGSQTKAEKNSYKINGNFSSDLLQQLIYDFIDKYIICLRCNNPETFYIEERRDEVFRECYACGYKSKIDNKLKNIILKELESNTSDYYSKKEEIEYVIEEETITYSITNDNMFIRTNNFINELSLFRDDKQIEFVLPSLEHFLVEKEIENEVCFYLDILIKESLVKKSDIFKYFQGKSKVIDKQSSKKIRKF
ncbi:hypothetical protein H312_02611, partial [Anncaliia algerae PRA339]